MKQPQTSETLQIDKYMNKTKYTCKNREKEEVE